MKWSATWDEAVTLSAASKRPLLIDAFSPHIPPAPDWMRIRIQPLKSQRSRTRITSP